MNFKTYLVGGALRDAHLGLPSKDNDYVVLAPTFEALRESLVDAGATIFTENAKCLTIRAGHPQLGPADFACGRIDGNYTDERRPDSAIVTLDIVEDLARRDFTMNAMARDIKTGELIDPFGGLIDIDNQFIRCVGEPYQRFKEDRLRPFRAARFAVTKCMRVHPNTAEWIEPLVPVHYQAVSTERIREEAFKAFQHDTVSALDLFFRQFPCLGETMTCRGIWLKPTTES